MRKPLLGFWAIRVSKMYKIYNNDDREEDLCRQNLIKENDLNKVKSKTSCNKCMCWSAWCLYYVWCSQVVQRGMLSNSAPCLDCKNVRFLCFYSVDAALYEWDTRGGGEHTQTHKQTHTYCKCFRTTWTNLNTAFGPANTMLNTLNLERQ